MWENSLADFKLHFLGYTCISLAFHSNFMTHDCVLFLFQAYIYIGYYLVSQPGFQLIEINFFDLK